MKQSIGAKTILYPTPVLVIGSYDSEGTPNIMTASWGGLCSSNPPSVAVSIRPSRLTYDNIIQSKAFTVNIPSADQVKIADYAGIHSGREGDKFAATGLTPIHGEHVNAPYVQEFPLVLECKVIKVVEIGVHTQFIGEILDVKVEERVIDADGNIDMGKLQPIAFAPGNGGYYCLGEFIGQAFNIGRNLV